MCFENFNEEVENETAEYFLESASTRPGTEYERKIRVKLVNCQNPDTTTTQANLTIYTKLKVGNISAVSGPIMTKL